MICIINCGTSWLKKIKQNLTDLNHSYKTFKIDELGNCNFEDFSGIIISGAPILLTKVDKQKYIDLFGFINTLKIPVLGICFGHQIIGLVYDASIGIGKMTDRKIPIEIIKNNCIFNDIKNNSLFRESHCEFITLPNEFELLAKSKSCANEAMKHKRKNIYGVQFHPEVSVEHGKQLLNNFVNIK